MVINERIIKFPVPEWNRVINSELDSIAYCICYQYNIDLNDFGPYGFDTDSALKIISKTFPTLLYLDDSNNESVLLTHVKNVKKCGLYLYGENEKLELLNIETKKYYLAKKKNEIKLKKLLEQEPLPPEPLLLTLSNKDGYKSDAIKDMLCSGYGLLIYHNYMPEAGGSLILFDQNIISSLKNNASDYGVAFVEVGSINDMKPW